MSKQITLHWVDDEHYPVTCCHAEIERNDIVMAERLRVAEIYESADADGNNAGWSAMLLGHLLPHVDAMTAMEAREVVEGYWPVVAVHLERMIGNARALCEMANAIRPLVEQSVTIHPTVEHGFFSGSVVVGAPRGTVLQASPDLHGWQLVWVEGGSFGPVGTYREEDVPEAVRRAWEGDDTGWLEKHDVAPERH